MKYFVFSDIHGCLNPLIDSLKKSSYDENNKNHHLLFLGDAFDKPGKWRNDFGVYQFLKEKVESGKLTWILGNHEIYLLNTIQDMDLGSFTKETIINIAKGLEPYKEFSSDEDYLNVLKHHKIGEFIENNTIDFFETKNYVFTHAFIPFNKKNNTIDPNWRNADRTKWNGARNNNGMKMVMNGLCIPNKTLVCGHIGTYYGNITLKYPNIIRDSEEFNKIGNKMKSNAKKEPDNFKIFYGDGVIGIDGRSFDTGIVNIFVVED